MVDRRFMTRVVMLALLASACAPRLYVNVLRPAQVNFGAAKKLTVYESQGRKSAREALLKELAAQAKSSGYYTLTDRSEDGIIVKVTGQTVSLSAPQAADEIGLRVDVLEWNADKVVEEQKDKKANAPPKEHWVGRVGIAVTAFNSAGTTFLAEKEYKAAGEDEKDEDAAIGNAARDVVAQLLDEVTPTWAQKAIALDDTEEAQKPIIDIARNGDVPKAIDAEKQLLAKSPNNAAATFNLAALLDSQGLYKEALPLYDQAIKLQPKELYVEMQKECQQRLADAEALAH